MLTYSVIISKEPMGSQTEPEKEVKSVSAFLLLNQTIKEEKKKQSPFTHAG